MIRCLQRYIVGVGVLLLTMALSAHALADAGRLHPDEAFYLSISRNAAIQGDWWLLSQPVDKPPLTFYANAAALSLIAAEADDDGVLHLDVLRGEFAGRLLALWSSVLLVAAAIALAQALFRDRGIAWLTGLLLALSPFRAAFAPTVFTDMPMLALGVLSLAAGAHRRWTLAGVCYALSLAAKPQTIFYLPLIAWLLLRQRNTYAWLRFSLPMLLMGVLLAWWDAQRMALGAESFLTLGQARYTPTTLTPLAEVPARVTQWWVHVQWFFGGGWLTAALGLLGVSAALVRRRCVNVVLLAWSVAFVGAHLLLTLNLFDRNQLVLLPVLAILSAWGMVWAWQIIQHLPKKSPVGAWCTIPLRTKPLPTLARGGSIILMMFVMLVPATRTNTLPIGGDDGTHDDIHKLAAYLNDKPVATVIYDRWLDWELDYYMGAWTDKRRVYYPTPPELAAGAQALDERGTRYLVAPDDVAIEAWLSALREASFGVSQDAAIASFVVYALQPPE